MEANPKHVIMSELDKQASVGTSDNTVKLSWLLPDTSLLTSGCNPDVPQFAGRTHRIVCPSTDDGDEGLGNDDDPPPLYEVPMEENLGPDDGDEVKQLEEFKKEFKPLTKLARGCLVT